MHFLGIVFLTALLIVFLAIAFMGSILRYVIYRMFGIKLNTDTRRNTNAGSTYQSGPFTSQSAYSDSRTNSTQAGNAHHEGTADNRRQGKIFSSDEGEYVEFEDLKD